MNLMTREERLTEAHNLMARERAYLREAHRAHRAALEAQFFGDDDEAHHWLEQAHGAVNAARLCADECEDVMGGRPHSSDSSLTPKSLKKEMEKSRD